MGCYCTLFVGGDLGGLSSGQEIGIVIDAILSLLKEPKTRKRTKLWQDEHQRYMNQLADYLEHHNIEICTLHD